MAYATFEELLSRYPDSPHASDALVAQARAGTALGQLDLIDNARQRLTQRGAAQEYVQKTQFERAEFFAKAKRDRYRAIEEYEKAYSQFTSSTLTAAVAKIRAADLVPGGNFHAARQSYEAVLGDYPQLGKDLRDWALCQIALCQFQLKDEQGAAHTFKRLLAAKPRPELRSKANLHLTGISTSASAERVSIVFDRGIRYEETETRIDQSFWAMQEVLSRSKEAFFSGYVNDPLVDKETRAAMLYRVCYAHFACGQGAQALEAAEHILSELQPEGRVRYQCLFMRAFLLGRSQRWAEAAQAWSELIEPDPPVDFLPRCYLEYARALDLSGDAMGALMALEELVVRFPERAEAERACVVSDEILLRNPQLRKEFGIQRGALLAAWMSFPPRPPVQAEPQDSELAAAIPGEPSLTGAQQ